MVPTQASVGHLRSEPLFRVPGGPRGEVVGVVVDVVGVEEDEAILGDDEVPQPGGLGGGPEDERSDGIDPQRLLDRRLHLWKLLKICHRWCPTLEDNSN